VVAGVMGVMATMTTVVAPVADRAVMAVAWSAGARMISPTVLCVAVRVGGVTE
jgi:hypothetical protein